MLKNENIKNNELVKLLVLFVISFLIIKIVFYRESFSISFLFVFSFFWNFVFPGFSLLYLYKEKLPFFERFIFGTITGLAIISIFSYYIGLVGIHVRYHTFFLPPLFIIIGIFLNYLIKKDII